MDAAVVDIGHLPYNTLQDSCLICDASADRPVIGCLILDQYNAAPRASQVHDQT